MCDRRTPCAPAPQLSSQAEPVKLAQRLSLKPAWVTMPVHCAPGTGGRLRAYSTCLAGWGGNSAEQQQSWCSKRPAPEACKTPGLGRAGQGRAGQGRAASHPHQGRHAGIRNIKVKPCHQHGKLMPPNHPRTSCCTPNRSSSSLPRSRCRPCTCGSAWRCSASRHQHASCV